MNAAASTVASPLYPSPDGLVRPLRVVMVGPPQVPEWIEAFRGLACGYDWLELTTLASPELTLPAAHAVAWDVRGLVAFERLLLRGNRSLAPVTMPGDVLTPQESLSARVDALKPDLVILIGWHDWAATLAGNTPRGCWVLDPALVDPRHAGLALLGPMVRGESATQMALVLKQPSGSPVDLAVSWGKTRHTSFLIQREDAFRKLPALLLRGLHKLAAGYVDTARHCVSTVQLQGQPEAGRAAGLRGLWATMRASPRWLTGWRRNGRIGWTLVLRLGGSMLDPDAPMIGSHALLKAPKGWWGDPFMAMAPGRKLIFVEEMEDPRRRKANIACVELVEGGARRLGTVLDEPGHLSFPQVFEWEGQWYMTVESGYDKRVSLYRATEFPMQWQRVHDLVTGRTCVDPTLYHHEGHWYLFANVAENRNNTCDELFLFVSERLEGPYRPHPASPIVCDVRRARMAGQLFMHRDRLIRPAQDCGPGYGNAVVFNEVLALGPDVYRERPLARLAPFLTRSVDGCHTYNAAGGIEVLDVLGRPPNGMAYLHVLDAADGEGMQAMKPPAQALPQVHPLAAPSPPHPGTPPR
ncbi:glucosamine inositolphosphorylceramide transferase family protein [Agrilutibacter solisilvae]|uniref:Glucosamine inositolphosphorylceramide transferase 1 N-terminal domain-containing protein n=1 Tax=Agrilutibacter solisilvae TaxID=2763317 RepID=A0A974XXN3_9GAMM|nr:hypothetical protein [Lysobacter solisilvae]QSX77687.1 hypothetical protein I8J32_013190 [Lysobacter solisilvae]